MRHRAHSIALAALVVASASTLARAAEEAGHAQEPNPVDFQAVTFVAGLVLFVALVLVLNKYVWPHILSALQAREDKIRGDIETAERTRKQAERALQEYEKALAEARNEAAKMLEAAKADQQKIATELRIKTDAEISSMRDAATRDIETAKRAAIAEVYSSMAQTATSIASKILQRELNPDDQRQLVEESLGQLAAVRAN